MKGNSHLKWTQSRGEGHVNGHTDLSIANYSPSSPRKAQAPKSENGYSEYHRFAIHQTQEGYPPPEVET